MKDPIMFDQSVGEQQIHDRNNFVVPFTDEDRKKMKHFPQRFMDNAPRIKMGLQYLETGTTVFNL